MPLNPARCLILTCGNTLREDDGVGPWLAQWAQERFRSADGVRVQSSQQWTPELAEDITGADSVLFIDSAANAPPGTVELVPVEPSAQLPRLLTHHLNAADLLALARLYYDSLPRNAVLLTVGTGSLELREGFSQPVQIALEKATALLEETVLHMLAQ
jgi:hydrogenase maturation protease